MGAGGSAAGSGVVVGLCLVLLGQQFGLLDLSNLLIGVVYFVAFAAGFAVVFGLVGAWLGHRYLRKHSGIRAWQASPEPADPAPSSSDPSSR